MSEVGEVAEVVEIAETPAAPAAAAVAPAAEAAAEEVVEKAVPGSLGTKVLDEITAAKQATELTALSKVGWLGSSSASPTPPPPPPPSRHHPRGDYRPHHEPRCQGR